MNKASIINAPTTKKMKKFDKIQAKKGKQEERLRNEKSKYKDRGVR